MFRPCFVVCLVLLTQASCHNPVSNYEAQKYLAPRGSANAGAIIVCRIIPDPEMLKRATTQMPGFRYQRTIVVHKLLDNGYTDSAFSCPVNDNGWYCWEYGPGRYLLRSVEHTTILPVNPNASREWMRWDIHATFSVPSGKAVYIGTFQQEGARRWTIKDESETARRILKKMKPDYQGEVSVELARLEQGL